MKKICYEHLAISKAKLLPCMENLLFQLVIDIWKNGIIEINLGYNNTQWIINRFKIGLMQGGTYRFWGSSTNILQTKMGVVPMIEEYLFIREDIINIFKANIWI